MFNVLLRDTEACDIDCCRFTRNLSKNHSKVDPMSFLGFTKVLLRSYQGVCFFTLSIISKPLHALYFILNYSPPIHSATHSTHRASTHKIAKKIHTQFAN